MMNTLRAPSARAPAFPRKILNASIASMFAAGMLAAAPVADARLTKLEITSRTTAFGGYSFAGVGQYDRIVGIAHGELDPNNPQNAVITDIELAPLTNGKVTYRHNFYILLPKDLSKGNHKVMYEPPNRGGKTHATLNRGGGGNDPSLTIDPAVLAQTFLWPRGYATVWSGWEDLGPVEGLLATVELPIAKNPDGTSITGPSYEYIVTGGAKFDLAYTAASLDKNPPNARLTHRVHLDDPPEEVPAANWSYTTATGSAVVGTAIRLNGVNFTANDIYEFSYIAKDPTVNGVGFAAVRDFNSFLKYEAADSFGTANPLFGHVQRIYTEISSQPGRLLNDFRHLGFNQDESGRKVLDGLMQWVAAGDGVNMNYRWGQTGRTERNRQDHLYLEGLFPIANNTTFDPISGTTDGRYKRCSATVPNTCPLGIEFFSSNEYWVKAASLMHTDAMGTVDLPDHPQSRLYNLASKQHGGAGVPPNRGNCQQMLNPLDSGPVQRGLWEAMDAWSTRGVAPPASQVPLLSNGTMVPPLPQEGVGFPNIPGVVYNGLKTTRYRANYGPGFYLTGVPTINPPVFVAPYQDNPLNGPIYPSYVPTTDSDGNEIAGIRLPELTAPLATYTGWALRAGPQADDGCEGSGQYIPFPRTQADRLATGDPRPSVEERYPSFGMYQSAVMRGLDDLVKNRFVLCEDAAAMQSRLLQAGLTAGVPPPKGQLPAQPLPPHCRGK